MFLAKALLYGYAILLSAIILNFVASKLGIKTWYEFILKPSSLSLMDVVWLFAVYPLALGLTALTISRIKIF